MDARARAGQSPVWYSHVTAAQCGQCHRAGRSRA
ncbi:MAG: hypothetical protein EON56_03115 [Alphaproteobacteria bacterium]|nr:MAG: hypothetical protein EON56_03115 [Alphaproteobacteria bacterium]